MKAKMRRHMGFGAIVAGLLLMTWLVWLSARNGPAQANGSDAKAAAKTTEPPAAKAEPRSQPPAGRDVPPVTGNMDEQVSSLAQGSPAKTGQVVAANENMDDAVKALAQTSPSGPGQRPGTDKSAPPKPEPPKAASTVGSDLVWPKMEPLDRRSEEHTSELQSLS